MVCPGTAKNKGARARALWAPLVSAHTSLALSRALVRAHKRARGGSQARSWGLTSALVGAHKRARRAHERARGAHERFYLTAQFVLFDALLLRRGVGGVDSREILQGAGAGSGEVSTIVDESEILLSAHTP